MVSFLRRSSQVFTIIVEVFFFFLARIAGILPITLDTQEGKVQMSHFLILYSLLLSILITVTVPVSIFVLLEMMNVFEDTMMLVVSIIEYFMAYAVAIVVLFQNIHMASRMAKVVNTGFPMYKSLPQVTVEKLRRRFYIYVLVMTFAGISSSAMNIAMVSKTNDALSFFLHVFYCTSIPIIILTTFVSLYYGGMLMVIEKFKHLNRRLVAVIDQLDDVVDIYDDKRRSYKITKSCELSDALDALSIEHDEICRFAVSFNELGSLQMLAFILNAFLSIVSQAFFSYVNIVMSMRRNESFHVNLIGGMAYAIVNAVLLFVIVNATSEAINRAKATGVLLHKVVAGCLDIRLERSIEIFSIQLLNQSLDITACKMFTLNFGLIYSVVGAATSYLIILVQFEMMRPSRN